MAITGISAEAMDGGASAATIVGISEAEMAGEARADVTTDAIFAATAASAAATTAFAGFRAAIGDSTATKTSAATTIPADSSAGSKAGAAISKVTADFAVAIAGFTEMADSEETTGRVGIVEMADLMGMAGTTAANLMEGATEGAGKN
ncbi:MAG: hypothetical protein KGL02_01880 [Acidobacteriota bacterium]|nr:hypothetical protein [Acidobacteriota bacterium]